MKKPEKTVACWICGGVRKKSKNYICDNCNKNRKSLKPRRTHRKVLDK